MQDTLELVTIFRAETTIQADIIRGLLNTAGIMTMKRPDEGGGFYGISAFLDIVVSKEDEVAACDLLREYLGENVKIGRIDSDIHTSTFSVLHYFIYPIYRFFRPLVIIFLIWQVIILVYRLSLK